MKVDVNSISLGVCIFCEQAVYNTDKKFMLGIERPYVNLWVHRTCYNGNDHETTKRFLQAHLPEYLNKYIDQEFSGNGKTKTEKIKRSRPAVPKSERPTKTKGSRYNHTSPSKV